MSDEGARTFLTKDGDPTPVYTGGGGFARVYGPHSALITEPLDPTEEGIVYADLDLAEIDLAKNTVDPAGHYSRPDVTRLVFDDTVQEPMTRPHSSQQITPTGGSLEDHKSAEEADLDDSEIVEA